MYLLNNQSLEKRKISCNQKKFIFLFLLIFACASVVFASGDSLVPTELTDAADSLQSDAQGPLVRTIISICAIFVGVGMAVNKDSQRMKTAGFAVIIGSILVMAGPEIVSKLMGE